MRVERREVSFEYESAKEEPKETLYKIDISKTPYDGDICHIAKKYFQMDSYCGENIIDSGYDGTEGRIVLSFRDRNEKGHYRSVYTDLTPNELRHKLDFDYRYSCRNNYTLPHRRTYPDSYDDELLELIKLLKLPQGTLLEVGQALISIPVQCLRGLLEALKCHKSKKL